MWKTSLPPAVVVSIASVSERRPTSRVAELLDGLDQLLERAGEAIQLPHHQGVALAHVLERRLEGRPLALRARGLLLEHPAAAGRLQGIELQGEILLLGRDPGVADQHATSRNSSRG